MSTFVGVLLLTFGATAFLFCLTGEKALGALPPIRRIRRIRKKWGALQVDLNCLYNAWDHRSKTGVNPGELRWFCKFELVDLLRPESSEKLDHETKQRPIADVMAAVGYRLERLNHLGHELRVYAFLYALMFAWHVLGNASIAEQLAGGQVGILGLAQEIGSQPLHFISVIEAAMLAIFVTRLIGELAGFKHLTK